MYENLTKKRKHKCNSISLKAICILLSVVMVFSSIPLSAFAEDNANSGSNTTTGNIENVLNSYDS